jgi:hypothetical protein
MTKHDAEQAVRLACAFLTIDEMVEQINLARSYMELPPVTLNEVPND